MALLVGIAALAPLGAPKPSASEAADKVVLANEHITVHFQGKKPMMDVFSTENESRGYKVFLQRIVELPPNATRNGAEVAWVNLAAAQNWTITNSSDSDGVHVTFKIEAPVETKVVPGPDGVPVPPDVANITENLPTANRTGENVTITIVFHIFSAPKVLTIGNTTVDVSTHEVKFDLMVDGWAWEFDDDVLGLEFLVGERGDANATGAADSDLNQSIVNVSSDGDPVGWVGWSETATATTNGTDVEIPVRSVKPGEGQSEARMGAKYWLVYEGSGYDNLTHDPSVGIVPLTAEGVFGPGSRIPAPGAMLAVAAGALAAVAILNRRRRT